MRFLSNQLTQMVFHSTLRDSKSPKVPKTLLNILTDFNKVVVRIVSTPSLIPNITTNTSTYDKDTNSENNNNTYEFQNTT